MFVCRNPREYFNKRYLSHFLRQLLFCACDRLSCHTMARISCDSLFYHTTLSNQKFSEIFCFILLHLIKKYLPLFLVDWIHHYILFCYATNDENGLIYYSWFGFHLKMVLTNDHDTQMFSESISSGTPLLIILTSYDDHYIIISIII